MDYTALSVFVILSIISGISGIFALLINTYFKKLITQKTIIRSSIELVEDSWKALENDNYAAATAIAFAALESAIRGLVPEEYKRKDFNYMLNYFSIQENLPKVFINRLKNISSLRNGLIHSSEDDLSKKDIEDFINSVADLISAIKLRSWREPHGFIVSFPDTQVISDGVTVLAHSKWFPIKRIIDIIGSLTGLIFFLPLGLLLIIAIKLDSKGPVVFKQERVGRNGKRFNMFKFRTMHVDTERILTKLESFNEVSGPVFKIKDDPRITLVGKILRRLSLDELPQLLNVLKGEMSFVGPRPIVLGEESGIDPEWIKSRLSFRPGLTSLWQVRGRNNLPFEKLIELDIQYMKKWSLWLDFKILLKSIFKITSSEGA